MGVDCAVLGCKNVSVNLHKINKLSGKNKLSFHMFPKDEKLRKIWIQKIPREVNFNYENALVCSEHFKEEDFVCDIRGELLKLPIKKKLKISATPSLNLGQNNIKEDSANDKSVQLGKQTQVAAMTTDEMRKRKLYLAEISDGNSTTDIDSTSSKFIQDISSISVKKKKMQKEDIVTEEELEKILHIVLERIHCLEQELEGLTHIMEDVKGRIEKLQKRC